MFRTKSDTTCRDTGRRARTQRTPREKTMQRTATQADSERAKAGPQLEKFRTIGPAAVLAALVCSHKKAKQAGTAPTTGPLSSQKDTD
jgi:hypothetical protein